MISNEKLDRLLRELKEEHAQIAPPPFISTRLRVEAVKVAIRRRRRFWMKFLIPTFSLALLAVVLFRWPTGMDFRLQSERAKEESASHAKPSEPVAQRQQPLLLRASYIRLPLSATLPEPTETTVVRVVLRKEKLRQFGFVVSEEHSSELTRVDFVLGEDGLARSVRLVGSIDGVSIQRISSVGSES